MYALIISGSAALIVFLGLFLGGISAWGWALLFAVLAFFGFYYALRPLWGIQALYAAYMAHIIVRSIWMYAFSRRAVFSKVP